MQQKGKLYKLVNPTEKGQKASNRAISVGVKKAPVKGWTISTWIMKKTTSLVWTIMYIVGFIVTINHTVSRGCVAANKWYRYRRRAQYDKLSRGRPWAHLTVYVYYVLFTWSPPRVLLPLVSRAITMHRYNPSSVDSASGALFANR